MGKDDIKELSAEELDHRATIGDKIREKYKFLEELGIDAKTFLDMKKVDKRGVYIDYRVKKALFGFMEGTQGIVEYNGKNWEYLNDVQIEKDFSDYLFKVFGHDFTQNDLKDMVFKYKKRIILENTTKRVNIFKNVFDVIPLVFNNGTLYYDCLLGDIQFKEKQFDPNDYVFFHFNFDYDPAGLKPGLFDAWIKAKVNYKSNEELFLKMAFADLLITANDSQVMLYMVSNGGNGKDTILNLFRQFISGNDDVGTQFPIITNIGLAEIGGRFANYPYKHSIINISSEIDRLRISETSKIKTILSRDGLQVERKGKDPETIRPLAKTIGMANSLPSIDFDTGINRRILTLQISDRKIQQYPQGRLINKMQFAHILEMEKMEFVNVILEGIEGLINYGFDMVKAYETLTSKEQQNQMLYKNNSVAGYLDDVLEKKPGEVISMTYLNTLRSRLTQAESLPSLEGAVSEMTIMTFVKNAKEYCDHLGLKYIKVDNGSINGKKVKRGTYILNYGLNLAELEKSELLTVGFKGETALDEDQKRYIMNEAIKNGTLKKGVSE